MTLQSQTVLGLIPARGGSKGVPRKNIHPVAGKPLIAWTIAAAKAAACIDRIIVSTEDVEIAAVAREYGAEVPFMRPAELAQDATPDLPVCIHVLEELRKAGTPADIVVWLRPTAPLRVASDIDNAIAMLKDADSVRSVSQSKAHPYWMKTLADGLLRPYVPGKDEETFTNRQSLPPVYMLNGSVDIMRASIVLERNTLWGTKVAPYLMPSDASVDIDTPLDIVIADMLMRRRERIAP